MASVVNETGGLGIEWSSSFLQACKPFSARYPTDKAHFFTPPHFPEVESASPAGISWEATQVVTRNLNGSFKLYICKDQELAVWIPFGDVFISNHSSRSQQTIAEYAKNVAWHKPEGHHFPYRQNVRKVNPDEGNKSLLDPDIVRKRVTDQRSFKRAAGDNEGIRLIDSGKTAPQHPHSSKTESRNDSNESKNDSIESSVDDWRKGALKSGGLLKRIGNKKLHWQQKRELTTQPQPSKTAVRSHTMATSSHFNNASHKPKPEPNLLDPSKSDETTTTTTEALSSKSVAILGSPHAHTHSQIYKTANGSSISFELRDEDYDLLSLDTI